VKRNKGPRMSKAVWLSCPRCHIREYCPPVHLVDGAIWPNERCRVCGARFVEDTPTRRGDAGPEPLEVPYEDR
jgi:hypothetical protein